MVKDLWKDPDLFESEITSYLINDDNTTNSSAQADITKLLSQMFWWSDTYLDRDVSGLKFMVERCIRQYHVQMEDMLLIGGDFKDKSVQEIRPHVQTFQTRVIAILQKEVQSYKDALQNYKDYQ